jgi:acyl-CoA dehydrogenase
MEYRFCLNKKGTSRNKPYLSILNSEKSTYPSHKNRVLAEGFRTSDNFYRSDKIFRNYLQHNLLKEGLAYMLDKLEIQGKESAGRINALSQLADKNWPELIKRNRLGEAINDITFHPSYWELSEIAV